MNYIKIKTRITKAVYSVYTSLVYAFCKLLPAETYDADDLERGANYRISLNSRYVQCEYKISITRYSLTVYMYDFGLIASDVNSMNANEIKKSIGSQLNASIHYSETGFMEALKPKPSPTIFKDLGKVKLLSAKEMKLSSKLNDKKHRFFFIIKGQ